MITVEVKTPEVEVEFRQRQYFPALPPPPIPDDDEIEPPEHDLPPVDPYHDIPPVDPYHHLPPIFDEGVDDRLFWVLFVTANLLIRDRWLVTAY